jgi:hypothetical protein
MVYKTALILSFYQISYGEKWMVDKQLQPFPCLTARFYGYYDSYCSALYDHSMERWDSHDGVLRFVFSTIHKIVMGLLRSHYSRSANFCLYGPNSFGYTLTWPLYGKVRLSRTQKGENLINMSADLLYDPHKTHLMGSSVPGKCLVRPKKG